MDNKLEFITDSKELVEGENVSNEKLSLETISTKLGLTSVAVLSPIAEHKKQQTVKRPPRLEENISKLKRDLDEDVIIKEEDGSRFTKVKGFFKKQWKKVLAAGVILGGAALVYNLVKQGQADSAQQIIDSASDTANQIRMGTSNVINNMPDSNEGLNEFASRTDVGNVGETFYTNNDAASGTNALAPNEYHQNEIINAVTRDNEILPADSMGDVLNYAQDGKDITSLQVGDNSGIDGHVNKVDGKPLNEVISQYQNVYDGGKFKQ